MKIVFICGSLEKGRDGVGDYTRKLAAELIKQGQLVKIIALYDAFVAHTENDFQLSEDISVPVLRLPANWKPDNRLPTAKKFIDEFDPDWLSLQFVIFGFHPKGLPLKIANELSFIGQNRRWHIMFHELWVQVQVKPSLKIFIWGAIQRLIIKSVIIRLKPFVLTTQILLYQLQLSELGFEAHLLPLFGNIRNIKQKNERVSIRQQIKSNNSLHFVVFGHIHPNAPIDEFANEVYQFGKKNKLSILLTIAGHSGQEAGRWAHVWQSAKLNVNILGEQSAETISEILNSASIGLSSTPVIQIGKSGAVAAMLEHNLPVISITHAWKPKLLIQQELPSGVKVYRKGNFEQIITEDFASPYSSKISDQCYHLTNWFTEKMMVNK